ncbi:MAG: hypothetical protein DMG40_26630 [Acidobacteria bacterium]|nr:MAG: hypothetical protein DMG40_26630 [Acidobacteriota bacterium]
MLESSPFNFRRVVIWIGRLLLGGISVYAGVSKIFFPNTHLWPMFVLKFSISTNLATFAQQVEAYKLLSPAGVDFVAHTLPFTEIALGLLLLIGWGLRVWASLVTLIMGGFLAVVTRAYLLHMNINCGCFATPEPLTGMTVIRDSLFVALAVLMTVFAFIEAHQPHPWSAPEKTASSIQEN